jgi:hypothetical protein
LRLAAASIQLSNASIRDLILSRPCRDSGAEIIGVLIIGAERSAFRANRANKVCNNYFLAKSKHFEICGDGCRKAQAIEARRQFDERNKDEKVEAIYENHYQYWHNRLRRLKTGNAAETDVTAFTNIFKDFRKSAIKRKNEVKNGKIKLSAFTSWLAEQQNIVDGMVKRGGEKWATEP